jgi:hypothetical protein
VPKRFFECILYDVRSKPHAIDAFKDARLAGHAVHLSAILAAASQRRPAMRTNVFVNRAEFVHHGTGAIWLRATAIPAKPSRIAKICKRIFQSSSGFVL